MSRGYLLDACHFIKIVATITRLPGTSTGSADLFISFEGPYDIRYLKQVIMNKDTKRSIF
jgi:hypothetical protein